jgi:hypothetical protein
MVDAGSILRNPMFILVIPNVGSAVGLQIRPALFDNFDVDIAKPDRFEPVFISFELPAPGFELPAF